MKPEGPATRRSLAGDLAAIGLREGDAVFVHAALRRVGPVLGGADMVIAALRDAVGPKGTVLAYTDWESADAWLLDASERAQRPPFDPLASRSARDNGAFPELLRNTPGALRSASLGASCAALGARAAWFVADHALDYGYGASSPFAKLVEAGGKVLMLGAPLDTMTLLHHAEHLADLPGKRVIRFEEPVLVDGRTEWRWIEEFDTCNPVCEGFDDGYFGMILEDFLATGKGRRSLVGAAPSILVEAMQIVPFAVGWMEARIKSAA
ncbi:MAG: aminoglycoside 3-N-acetyltransferase [Devosia sp.]